MQDTAGEARTSSSVMYSYGPPHMAKQKQDDQLEHTYSSYVRIRDVALKTSQKGWMIGRSGEWGSGISLLAARHDDDEIVGWFNVILVLDIWLYYIIDGFWYIICSSRDLWRDFLVWDFDFSVYISGFAVAYYFWKFNWSDFSVRRDD